MANQDHFRKLERMYAGAPVNQFFRPRLTIGEGRAELRLAVRPDFFHAAGAAHGVVYFKAMDDSAFFAASSLVEDVFVLTAGFTLHLLRPISAGEMIATATRGQQDALADRRRHRGPRRRRGPSWREAPGPSCAAPSRSPRRSGTGSPEQGPPRQAARSLVAGASRPREGRAGAEAAASARALGVERTGAGVGRERASRCRGGSSRPGTGSRPHRWAGTGSRCRSGSFRPGTRSRSCTVAGPVVAVVDGARWPPAAQAREQREQRHRTGDVSSWLPPWPDPGPAWKSSGLPVHAGVPLHAARPERLPRGPGVVGVADDPEVGDGGLAVARPGHDMVELQPVGRAAAAAPVERPAAAAAVALPDGAADGGGDGLARTGAAVDRRRGVRVLGGAGGAEAWAAPGARAGFAVGAAATVGTGATLRGRLTCPRALACFSSNRSSAASMTCSALAPGMAWERPSRAASSFFRNWRDTVMWSRRSSAVSGSTSSRWATHPSPLAPKLPLRALRRLGGSQGPASGCSSESPKLVRSAPTPCAGAGPASVADARTRRGHFGHHRSGRLVPPGAAARRRSPWPLARRGRGSEAAPRLQVLLGQHLGQLGRRA